MHAHEKYVGELAPRTKDHDWGARKRYVGELGMKRTSGSKIGEFGGREACRCMRMKSTSGSLRRAQKIKIGERVKGTSGSLA